MSLEKRNMEEKTIEGWDKTEQISFKEFVFKIREWYRYLLSRFVIILVFSIIGGCLGFFYASFKKSLYVATTTFVLEDGEKGGMGQYGALAAMAGLNLGNSGGGVFQGDNIMELYKSRTMIQKALLSTVNFNGKKELLIDRYINFKGLRDKWKKTNPELNDISFSDVSKFTVLQDSVITGIVNELNLTTLTVAKSDKSQGIIKVEIKSTDELFAKAFADEIVSNVNKFYIETKTKKSLENVQILQKKTDSVKSVINGTIYASAETMDATPNLNPVRQRLRVGLQTSQYNLEANKLILAELTKNLELSKISLNKEAPLIQIIDGPVLPLEKHVLGKMKGLVIGVFLSLFLVSFLLLTYRFLSKELS